MASLNLDDVEQIKRVVVDPVIAALKAELEAQVKPLIATDSDQEKRIAKLESNQRKALIGFGALSLGVSAAVTSAWQWLQSKIRIS